jgi:hypothetical protein
VYMLLSHNMHTHPSSLSLSLALSRRTAVMGLRLNLKAVNPVLRVLFSPLLLQRASAFVTQPININRLTQPNDRQRFGHERLVNLALRPTAQQLFSII